MPTGPDDATLADRLAARTLELVDVPSESREEAALFDARRRRAARRRRWRCSTSATRACWPARPAGGRATLLAGHLDTVPAQGNIPGRRDGERVHGLGASDMKGGLAVMVELALAGADFGGPVLPPRGAAVRRHGADAAARARAGRARRRRRRSCWSRRTAPIHAGCLGNVNARWTFHGRSGHSARPWLADNAIERAAAGIVALAAQPRQPGDRSTGSSSSRSRR